MRALFNSLPKVLVFVRLRVDKSVVLVGCPSDETPLYLQRLLEDHMALTSCAAVNEDVQQSTSRLRATMCILLPALFGIDSNFTPARRS